MPAPPPIRILAPAKATGDLFGRLVSDLFLALGYDQPRLNVHKAGREIDVQAKHRTEPRWVVAECKATAKPIGGADINKFAGTLEVERRKLGTTEGYFLSLSGFTETAFEQERDFGAPPRVALLDGRRIVEELVRGRIVVSLERALERAGRSAAWEGTDLVPEDRPQLLAHDLGWVWAVRFRRNVEPTHVALVHADGELLSPALAREVLEADRSVLGDLHRLTCLAPEIQDDGDARRLAEARRAYFTYLAAECGEIELEGLPADQEIGSRRLRLESLFVPLHLELIRPEAVEEKQSSHGGPSGRGPESARLPVGEALTKKARLAVLAVPGGGKMTLLKRLAVSYAFPERRTDLGDRLPDREWFPVLLRCRQIEDRATEPIISLIASLGERAEMGESANAFRELLLEALREGRVLFLVDGLDEIADSGKRMAFVTQLRTFLSTYPGVDVVVTSREAGFRIVAGALSAHCDHYRIADFDRDDIERLTVAWHREVVGVRPDVESQARSLAATIWETDRVRRLAVNPLLLTTLLLVRRWAGQIPSRRSVLYEKAIEVLLWSWNIQGFEPLDVQEVIPQLAFLAWRMMEDEVQRISKPRLQEVLQTARRQMPEVLAYAKLSASEFVERVERRSSLLVLSGHEVEDGRLVPLYEFRHLTFQEYLAAKALVEGYYHDRREEDTLVAKLKLHLEQEAWREVVSLAAVLAGRKVIPLVELLIEQVSQIAGGRVHEDATLVILLSQCLLDEIQIPPGLAEKALEAICSVSLRDMYHAYQLAESRYGDMLREVTCRLFLSSSSNLVALGESLSISDYQRRGWPFQPEPSTERLRQLEGMFNSKVDQDRAVALLNLSWFAFQASNHDEYRVPRRLRFKIVRMTPYALSTIRAGAIWEQFAGSWALTWLFRMEGVKDFVDPGTVRQLLSLWLAADSEDVRSMAAWAIHEMPLVARTVAPLQDLREPEVNQILSLLAKIPDDEDSDNSSAALIAAYYNRLCLDEELAAKALQLAESGLFRRIREETLRKLLEQLGEPGQAALRQLDKEQND